MRSRTEAALLAAAALLVATPAGAQDALDTGDTAWILTSSALVLFMTIPGLALFYAGLVRAKNVLSVLMHCLRADGALHDPLVRLRLLAGLRRGQRLLRRLRPRLRARHRGRHAPGHHPRDALLRLPDDLRDHHAGPDRGRLRRAHESSRAMLWSSRALWLLVVYAAHLPHDLERRRRLLLATCGVFDFAGGIVVHITAGIGALVACIDDRAAQGLPRNPHDAAAQHDDVRDRHGHAVGGLVRLQRRQRSSAADGGAAMAITVTQISASTAAFTWMAIEWLKYGKPSVLGLATGAIAGLAAVTPASAASSGRSEGSRHRARVGHHLLVGLASTTMKRKLGYDDSLDVFGVHGVGGFVGTVLAAVFAHEMFGGKEGAMSIGGQLGTQLFASVVTIVYTGVASFVILKAIDATLGLRVTQEDEVTGLDTTLHAEVGYDL